MPNFSGWRRWDKELGDLNDLQTRHKSNIVEAVNTVFDQITYDEDIPPDTDLAEFMKTAKHNVIYRVSPNTNVKNTCDGNTQHTFYVLEGTFIAGYDTSGGKHLCNFVNKKFTRWFRVSRQAYSLEALGLSDADFSDKDFLSILLDISTAVGIMPCDLLMTITSANYPNFYNILLNQLKIDGFDYVGHPNWYAVMKMERDLDPTSPIKIELLLDTNHREKTLVGYANKDAGKMIFYGFRELAAIQKSPEIELLNGWTVRNYFSVNKIGNRINVDFIIDSGSRAHGAKLFVLPAGFRPSISKSCPVPFTGEAKATIAFNQNGEVIIYGWEDSTGYIIFSDGFTI